MEKMSGNVKNVNAGHANKFGRKRKEKFKVFKPRTSTSNVEKREIKKLQDLYDTIDSTVTGKFFRDFPLSQKTLRGLKENGYLKPTEIQRESIMLSLRGLDILGAAKTGSGKTLAFLIPILERLYCSQWTRLDGVGALIITPTRELAYQIFETLRKVGKYHDFSAGLIIGGKDLKFERKRMDQVNIVICTPGRLLQHMDENPLFDCANLQILVLDEADRCLDMGFEETMNNIIQNLPTERQTLLFSATQTRSVKDLARLSLKDPMYVSVHEHAKHSTPEALKQSYIVVGLEEKLSMLWSFLRNHTKHKILVFLSSCKQVKYFYEAFCRLRPGVSLLALYGTLHQMRRMAIYESFCRKSHAVLFATDIAARGLDFPAVHWVVQLDCPEDAATYIHRAGRTARYQKGGESLLVLLPSEKEAMLERLEAAKIPINEIKINENKLQNPWRKLEALLARDKELKASAQRAFVAYVKSVFLMKDKSVFDVKALNTDAFSRSLGLAIPPRIRFLQRMEKQQSKSQKKEDNDSKSESDPEVSEDDETENDNVKEIKRSPKLQDKAFKHEKSFGFGVDGSSDSDEDILKVKRKNHELDDDTDEQLPGMEVNASDGKGKKRVLTKAAIAKRILKKKIVANQKKVFDEEGNVILNHTKEKVSDLAREYENEDAPVGGIDIEKAKLALKEEDQIDKKLFRERVKAKHKEERRKQKEANKNLKKVDEEVEEDEESYSSSDSEGPDLSWLPDPDKVFKKKSEENGENENSDGENEKSGSEEESDRSGSGEENDKSGSEKESEKFGSDDEDDDSGAEESSLEDEKPSPTWKNKRKSSVTHENYGVKRQKNIHRLKNPNLTLEEEEALAMQLLRH